MPGWAVQPYLDRDYVSFRPIRKSGLFANLYAATTREAAATSYMIEFLSIMKRVSFNTLTGRRCRGYPSNQAPVTIVTSR